MQRYILRRLGEGLIAVFFLATVVFILARIIGNPVDTMLPPDFLPEQKTEMIHRLGLDRPYYEQYFSYMWGVLHGDLGTSIKFNEPVAKLFFQFFPNTVVLAFVAMAMAMVFGFSLGMISATNRGTWVDQLVRGLSVIGMSAPAFWVGLMLILIFAIRLDWLPVARMGGWDSYILPAFTWSLFLLAGTARLVRSSVIEVLDSEYVKLARIKGASETVVLWKHALRNALLPVVTFAGVELAALLNGSVVIESVFAWPGVGRLMYQGITGRDYPLVQGCLIIVGIIIILINLSVDLLYAVIDPRIRLGRGRA